MEQKSFAGQSFCLIVRFFLRSNHINCLQNSFHKLSLMRQLTIRLIGDMVSYISNELNNQTINKKTNKQGKLKAKIWRCESRKNMNRDESCRMEKRELPADRRGKEQKVHE